MQSKQQLLEMKWVFEHEELKTFGLNSNKYE